ncbi:MAG: poly(3-hydroxybutyrate) depolymerase [Marinobacterium sp.]|nr:poly(3-hydroxybutyrate) depolymerase [Marinobacterium sp.]
MFAQPLKSLPAITLALSLSSLTMAQEPSASLPALSAQANQTSVSGLSSGAFMAAQFHVAYSSKLVGAGVVAGGPWNCAGSNPLIAPITTAVSTCMDPCKYSWFGCPSNLYPNSGYLSDLAKTTAGLGHIDPIENLKDDKVYIFSGQKDKTVVTGVVDTTAEFYQKLGLADAQVFYNSSIEAGHAFITKDPADTSCAKTEPPYINNCEIPQAQRILTHIYGKLKPASAKPTGELLRFNQSEFIDSNLTSMDSDAYVYIPKSCKTGQCRVHISIHGCRQGISEIGTTYIEDTGYMEVADTNQLIILYPQVKKSQLMPMNPRGCWDFWGYSSNNLPPYIYYRKDAPQMLAINRMIDRLLSPAVQVSQQ